VTSAPTTCSFRELKWEAHCFLRSCPVSLWLLARLDENC
jgi:hypothetical protein